MKKLLQKLKPAELAFKSLVFACLKPWLRLPSREASSINPQLIASVLVFRPERLGDTLVSFPLIDHLRQSFPHWKISILTSPRSFSLVHGDPRFNQVFVYRKSLLRDWQEIRRIRQQRFDCVIDLICGDSVTTLILAKLCGPKAIRFGQQKNEFAPFFDYSVFQPTDDRMEHTIDISLHLAEGFGLTRPAQVPLGQPHLPERAVALAGHFVKPIRQSCKTVIGYNLSAGSPGRMWPIEKSRELLTRLVSHYPSMGIIAIATASEREDALGLARAVGTKLVVVPEKLSFLEASAIVQEVDLLITPDTSLVHVARSFGKPVVGLYPDDIKNNRMWYPYGQKSGVVHSRHAGNIHDITVDQVFERFVQLFSGANSASTGRI